MRTVAGQFKAAEKRAARYLWILIVVLSVRELRAQTQAQCSEPAPLAPRHRKVVVSIPHRKLALIEEGQVKKVYAVAVGAQQSPTPVGKFEVKTRLVKPTYYHPGKVIPAGANNPLGTRWIGLSTRGYGIHGTNVEESIGKAASHGCIRMHRADLEELFAAVEVGDQVEIRAEPDAEVAGIFGELPAAEDTPDGVGVGAAVNGIE
ncbi:MAG: L,D-transpeptidase [Acidobacteria bacterium]|nr:MAG: L,D-transpeptidase [Acidobacteriota bacterium]PYY17009.1 MAG: L,D-transpeptidase [Acidobacteriota bacterium]